MMEYWNNGMMGIDDQSEYNILVTRYRGVISGAKAGNGCLTNIIIKCSYSIDCRIDLFPLFRPSVPTFQYSIIPCG
jgi:hypothetical protein